MRAAGLDVRAGGRHLGFGTENATIRFGLDYLELISVHDEAEALGASPRSAELARFLRAHEAGLVGYALAGDDLDAIARRLRAVGQAADGPTPMRRRRPDGVVLEWRLLIPDGVAWRRPWPFFIEWALPDDERLALERPGAHPCGATAVAGVAVAVDDLERAIAVHAAALGPPAVLGRGRATFDVGGVAIDLVAGQDAPGGLERGPGPFELRLRGAPSAPPVTSELLPTVRVSVG